MEGTTGSDTLTERLLLAGATFLLILFSVVVPVAAFLAPVPLAVLHARHGPQYGIGTAVAVSLGFAVLTLSPIDFAQILLLLGPGVALGEGIRDGLSAKVILGAATAALFAALVVFMFMAQRVQGTNPFDEVRGIWEAVLEATVTNDPAAPPERVEELRRLVELEIALMQRAMHAGLFLGSLGIAAIDMSLTRRVLEKLPGEERAAKLRLPRFAQWRFGMGAGIGFLLGWPLLRWFPFGETVASVLFNVMVACGVLVSVQGAAVLWYLLGRTNLRKVWRVAAAIAAVVASSVVPGLALGFTAAGLIDMIFDVRRLGREA